MDTRLAESINTFGISPKADFVPQSEPSITVPASMLQELLGAVQDLKEEVTALRMERDQDRHEIASLRAQVRSLETTQEQDTSRICCDIAFDRQRLAKLEKSTPGPTDEERIERLESYLKDKKSAGLRPEASFTEARTYLEVSRSQFSQLISKLDPRDFVVSPNPLNYKSKMIGLSHKM